MIFAGMYGFLYQDFIKAWSWQYYVTYTVIQKNLLLSLLGIMIVEKIIVVSISLCCKKMKPTGQNKVGTGKVTLGN
jgi:hypothetical protein